MEATGLSAVFDLADKRQALVAEGVRTIFADVARTRLPVLRYRAMVNGVSAPGLASRLYFNRYTEDAVDLCDVLSSFSSQGKATLHELCRVMGLPGKPSGIHGAEVEKFYKEGKIREIADFG